MPALIPTDLYATITFLAKTIDRAATLTSVSCPSVDLTMEGIKGEARSGLTRSSCGRVTSLHPLGTPIRNVRQVSVMSREEISKIAQKLDLENLDPQWIGASIVVEGLPDFTHLPPSSRLQAENGTTLVVDMLNLPCNFAAREVENACPGHGLKFRQAANGLRGVTMWVERAGSLKINDRLRLHIPSQRAWKNPVSG